jgi:hypothetical protein
MISVTDPRYGGRELRNNTAVSLDWELPRDLGGLNHVIQHHVCAVLVKSWLAKTLPTLLMR